MNHINNKKLGLVVGGLFGLQHFVWSVLVLLGLAKPLINFILRLHFINLSFTIASFSAITALTLIIVTSIVGYAVGYIAAFIWNWVHRG